MTEENQSSPQFLARPLSSNTENEPSQEAAEIAYLLENDKPLSRNDQPVVVFCGGFHSNMRGSKAKFLSNLCKEKSWSYCRFDYQGHGESSGRFEDGTIGIWYQDALSILKKILNRPVVLVGSSMGGWMSMLLARQHPELVKGLLLIAPAPDFPTKLMWPAMGSEAQNEIERNGVWYRPSEFEGEDSYPITKIFIEESKDHNLLDAPLNFDGPVHILHGIEDEVVPVEHAQQVMDCIQSTDVTLELIKGGDHRLSHEKDLNRLANRLEEMMRKLAN